MSQPSRANDYRRECRIIFSDDVLFLHVPKTGGLSAARYLLDTLPRPLTITHPISDAGLHERGISQLYGSRHESLVEARDVLQPLGRSIPEFRTILVGLRNPYDQEVSRYAYLRQGHKWEAGPEQDLALVSDFEAYAIGNPQAGGHWAGYGCDPVPPHVNEVRDYFVLDGVVPDNLRVLRFEHLAEYMLAALADLGTTGQREFPWDNVSCHFPFGTYYTPSAEAAVYSRYRWVFDLGFYDRLVLAPVGDPGSGTAPSASIVGEKRASELAAIPVSEQWHRLVAELTFAEVPLA